MSPQSKLSTVFRSVLGHKVVFVFTYRLIHLIINYVFNLLSDYVPSTRRHNSGTVLNGVSSPSTHPTYISVQ